MNKTISLILIIGLSLILFQNCDKKREVNVATQSGSMLQKTESITPNIISSIPSNYSINVEKIDSTQFHSARNKLLIKPNKIAKITDFAEAEKLLRGVVEFMDSDDDYHIIKQLTFRNGKQLKSAAGLDFSFVAYYPEEDILLGEGGHTSDVSYNLKNGQETELTGNPDLITSSPSNEFRLNGHFGGQECYSYFIQRKVGKEFIKIIQLDDEFEKITKVWLCTIGESFWTDEKTLYLTETDFVEKGVSKQYFKVEIVEKNKLLVISF